MTYIIAGGLYRREGQRVLDVCPVDCIYEGPDQLYIHPDECIDCGACEPECPMSAIFPEEEVPEKWASYSKKNYAYFGGGEAREVARGKSRLA